MSWICPTCGRAVALWQQECPHCVSGSPDEATQAGHEAPAPEPEGEPPAAYAAQDETSPDPALAKKRSGVPWAAYVVLLAAVATLVVVLWPAERVRLRLETEPSGATVLVDGARKGQTPLELSGLTDGYRYRLRVELEGYQPYQKSFVAHAQKEPWTIRLAELTRDNSGTENPAKTN